MDLFNKIKQKASIEFIDIIEWINNTSDTMIWQFPRYQAEIKNAAQQIVNPQDVQPKTGQFNTNNIFIGMAMSIEE